MPPTRFQAPSGTRDMYPQDLLRRRYIEKLWRDTAIRHGFEEIDGPTFEHADLYSVKSGEGILSELFQVFSGKDAGELDAIRAGKSAPYALRPEFTPTLARMYAAKAGSLPKPTKWFWMQNCYRAERQQRGRLREFGQWNCDILGLPGPAGDIEIVKVCRDMLQAGGLTPANIKIRVNDRRLVVAMARQAGVSKDKESAFLNFLDGRSKRNAPDNAGTLASLGLDATAAERFDGICRQIGQQHASGKLDPTALGLDDMTLEAQGLYDVIRECNTGGDPWCVFDPGIVRGLAYYTGVVFEVIVDGERAVAGGGRYDNLIELFGGPPTPACGFGMGDVVLGLVLQDKGIMPVDSSLLDRLSVPPTSHCPQAFVLPANDTLGDSVVQEIVDELRGFGLHARCSYKTTKNIGKLLQDAVAQKSKLAVIIESADEATIKDLRTNTQDAARTKLADLPRVIAARLAAAN